MRFVIRFIDTRECIFVDDLLGCWQTKVNEYDRETCVVVKKKEKFEPNGQKGRNSPGEIREIYPRTGDRGSR